MNEIVTAAVLFGIAVFALVMSIRSFREKGIPLNNAYLHATEEERETMDKTPYYRQTGVVFLLIALVFALNGLDVITQIRVFSYAAIGTIAITVLYAIVSSVWIEKRKK